MLSEFFSWWVRQLSELLPARLRRTADGSAVTRVSLLGGAMQAIEIAAVGRRGAVTLCRTALDEAGLAEASARLAGKRRPAPVVLLLPEAALLEREVVLPLAAERDPEAVLGYEMDRLTPFRAAEIVWKVSALKRDRARNRLSLRLSLVPRSLFSAALAPLARIGLAPDFVEAPAPGGGWRRIALAAPGAGRTDRRILRLAAALAGLLAMIAAGSPSRGNRWPSGRWRRGSPHFSRASPRCWRSAGARAAKRAARMPSPGLPPASAIRSRCSRPSPISCRTIPISKASPSPNAGWR